MAHIVLVLFIAIASTFKKCTGEKESCAIVPDNYAKRDICIKDSVEKNCHKKSKLCTLYWRVDNEYFTQLLRF